MKESVKGGAITIIYKEDDMHDCHLILTDKNACQKKTSDMMETHNDEAEDIISNKSSNNRIYFSQLFPVKATSGMICALLKQHKLSHLISAKTN